MKISTACAAAMHACCKGTRETCACPDCHLGPCVTCEADNLMAMYDDQCAPCARSTIVRHRPTYCDRCGSEGAYRNPATRKNEFLCTGCHLDNGEPITSAVPVSALAAPGCQGKDITDDAHTWVSIRGTRFQCRCGMKKYDAKLRDQRRRQEMTI